MPDKIEGLQVARAIAVLVVVCVHAPLILIRFPAESYVKLPFVADHGDVGVSLFFVVSGFIIAHVIQRPGFRMGDFFRKRFFRLWPLYAFCTLLYVSLYVIQRGIPAGDLLITYGRLAKSLFFWPQLEFPVLHPGWSLEHEVVFYLYAGVVCGLAGYRLFFAFMTLISAASVWYWAFGPASWDYEFLSYVNVLFWAGMVLHAVWRWRKPRLGWLLALLGVALIVGGVYLSEAFPIGQRDFNPALEPSHDNLTKTLSVAFGSMVLIYGLLGLRGGNSVWKGAVWIGDRSYSLYLIHFCTIPVFQVIHRDVFAWPEWAAEPLIGAYIALSLLLAAIVFQVIEAPTSDAGRRPMLRRNGAR